MDEMSLANLRGVPLLFTYRQTATLAAGFYDFSLDTTANPFTPDRPLSQNVLYRLKTMNFAMDITEDDYEGAIDPTLGGVMPEFSMYIQSEGGNPELREPLVLSQYFKQMPYGKSIIGKDLLSDAYPGASATPVAQSFNQNRLLGLVNGILAQTASLLGKTSVTATISFTAVEIIDQNIISAIQGQNSGGHEGGVKARVFE
jgi:hypothetical protein